MCSLDKLIEEHGLTSKHRSTYFTTIMTMFGDFVTDASKGVRGKDKSTIVLSEKGYEMASHYYALVKRRVGKRKGLGYIYCFFAMEGDGCRYLKVGKSSNWKKRFQQYAGPAKPREVVGILTVWDMDTAEKIMLTRFRRWFDQFDQEWFKIPHGFEKLVRDLFFQPLQDKLEG